MDNFNNLIRGRIIRDMSEGVMVLGLDGTMKYLNGAAEEILGLSPDSWKNKRFAQVFFGNLENDDFNQTILDAVYDADSKHENLVPYHTGDKVRELNVLSSYLRDGDQKIGIIVVLNDVTELAEMRFRHLQEITYMLNSFVTALSTAIDERSHYTANHTKNMVLMGEAFLKWLDETAHPWRFDEDRKHSFLMSVWLHDVGKLTVPLEIMDKATRLGDDLERVENRFDKARLLNRIAVLEARISEEEFADNQLSMRDSLQLIHRINDGGILSDSDLEAVQALSALRYTEEDGVEAPLFTEDEITKLSIRKGTLTADERAIMQSHVTATRTILDHVHFPGEFSMVPEWAGEHHELLNGMGYPRHLRGDEIPREVRLLTLLDIFEALTAKDRPYKKPMSLERALEILHNMVDEGSLDGDMLALFQESRAWEAIL